MSELLDERVVEMRFDNADFERNVGQSIKTINKLKDSLDFDEAGQSFDNLAASAAKVDLSPIEKSIEQISVKFNMLEMIAANVLGNIVSKAVDAGSKLVKSVSVDQVTAGWTKYEQKTSSVQTIIAATGASIDTVNQKLEKLIWFADETSYDFVDMVNNIGKFTSAGIDLDTAVNSMMGISNWAALSGAGIQQASRAMYNLSQSIGMGYVAVQDWKSIELANMATKEFKETAIAMALELGTLKEINGQITTLDGKATVTAETMRESLKKKWFTSDVLNDTLQVYSDFANKVKEFQAINPGFDTVSRAMEEMVARGEVDIDSIGYRAFVAAQEAKTLTEAINATKDAVSSGWMRTFELIFGNYDQAKKLWTNLANDMYDIFASPGDKRNDQLAEIMQSNYQKMLAEMPDPDEFNTALYNKLFEYTKTNRGEEYAAALFSQYDTLEELLKNTSFFGSELKRNFSAIAEDNTAEIKKLESLSKSFKDKELSLRMAAIRLATNQYGAEEAKAREELDKIGLDYDYLIQFADAWKNGVEVDWDAAQKEFEKNLDDRIASLHDFNKQIKQLLPLDKFFEELGELGGRDKLIGGFENIILFFKNLYLLLVEIGDGFSSLFGGGSFLSSVLDGFYNLTTVLGDAGAAFEMLQGIVYDLFHTNIPMAWDEFLHGYDVEKVNSDISETGEIIDNVSKSIEHVPGLIDRLSNYYQEHLKTLPVEVQNTLNRITGNVTSFFNSIPEKIKKIKDDVLGVEEVYNEIIAPGQIEQRTRRTGGFINEIKEKLENAGNGFIPKALDGISQVLSKISGFLFGYEKDGEKISGVVTWIYNKVNAFINLLKDIGKHAKDIFGTVFEDIKTFFTGGKYSFSDATIWALPDRLNKHFREFVNSKTFRDVKAFFFGKDVETELISGPSPEAEHIPGLFEKISITVQNTKDRLKELKDNFLSLIPESFLETIKYIFDGGYFSGEPVSLKTFLLGDKDSFSYLEFQLERIKNTDWFKNIRDFFAGKQDTKAGNGALNSFFQFFHTAEEYEKANIFGKIKLALQDLQIYLFGWRENADGTGHAIEGKLTPIIERIKQIVSSVKDAANAIRNWLPGAVDTVRKKIESVVSSKPFQDVKAFFFGDKSKGKDNLFTRVKTGIDNLVKGAGYTNLHDFILGNDKIGLDNVLIRTKNSLHDFFLGNEAKGIDNFLVRTKNTIHDFFLGNESKGIDNIFERIKKKVNELISNSGYANLHDFIFGNQELNQDNVIVRILDAISAKFEELKTKFPWLRNACDFLMRQVEKVRNFAENVGFAVSDFLFGHTRFNTETFNTEHVDGFIDKIKKLFEKIKSINLFNNDKKPKSIFEIIGDFFSGAVDGIRRVMMIPRIIHDLLPVFGAISVLLIGVGGLNIGNLEISSPLGNMVDMLTDIVKSVAIIVGLIVGLSIYMRFLDGKGWATLAGAAVAIGAILAGLLFIANKINGKSEDGVIAQFKGAAAMFAMINFINSLVTFTAMLTGAIIALSLVSKLVGTDVVFTAAMSIALVIAAVGFSIKMMNDSFKNMKDSAGKLKTHTGELFGMTAVIWSIANLISTIALAFGFIYMLTKGKKWEDIAMPVRLMVGALASVVAILLIVSKQIQKLATLKPISGSTLGAIVLLTVFVGLIGGLAVALSVVGDWKEIAVSLGGFSLLLWSLAGAMKILSTIPKVDLKVVGAALAAVGVLGVLAIGLMAFANAIGVEIDFKKVFSLMVSIIEMAVAFGAVAVVIGAIGNFAKLLKDFDFGATIVFLGKVAGIVAIIVAVVIVIAGLIAKIEGAKEYIENAGDILEAISNAIGKIISGFLGGLAEGVTDSMPAIAKNLSDFMKKLGPFLKGIEGLKDTHSRGIGILVDLMLKIAATELLGAFNSIIEWATGGSNLDNAFTMLSRAADGLVEFAGKVKDVDYKDVKHAADIIPALLNIAVDDRYKTGGISGLIDLVANGSVNLGGLFRRLNENGAADGLREFESKVKGLSYEDIEAAADVIPALLNIAVDERYKSGGISGLIDSFVNGSIDLGALFTKLNEGAADGLKTFESKVKGLKYEDVEAAADVIPALLNIATDNRYRTGGKISAISTFLNGSVDLGALFTKLNEGVADGLRTFESKVKGLKYEDVEAAADIIPALLNIASDDRYRTGGEFGAISSFLSGSVDLGELFRRLNEEGAADGIKTFESKVKGLKYEDVAAAADVIPALLNIATDERYNKGGIAGALNTFINGDTHFDRLFEKLNNEVVDGFVQFSEGVADISLTQASKAVEVLPKIFDMLSDDHYRSGGIGGRISELLSGSTNFKDMFDALLGDGTEDNPGIIKGLSELSDALTKNAFNDSTFDLVSKTISTLQSLFNLMSFDTSGLISNNDGFGYEYDVRSSLQRVLDTFSAINDDIIPELSTLQENLISKGINAEYLAPVTSGIAEFLMALHDLSNFDVSSINIAGIGNYVIEGLVISIGSQESKNKVHQVAYELGLELLAGLQEGTEVQSPSKAAIRIGQFVAQGLTNGLLDGEPITWAMARQLGEGTIKALQDGADRYAAYGLSQHAINMVTEDLLDENIFNMPDFSFIDHLGMENIDFEKMRSFLQEKFGEVFDPIVIDGFVNSYMHEFNKLPKEIKSSEYTQLMKDIAKGDYGLGQDSIIDALTEELGSVSAAQQAWEDYNGVLEGNIKLNEDLIKQRKQNPPMTYEQYMDMIKHDQEGIDLANKGFFDELAKANGTSREIEMRKLGYDPNITQKTLDNIYMSSSEFDEFLEKYRAKMDLELEEDRLLREQQKIQEQIDNSVNKNFEKTKDTRQEEEILADAKANQQKSVEAIAKYTKEAGEADRKQIDDADSKLGKFEEELAAEQSLTEHYDKLEAEKLNSLLSRIQNGTKEISQADAELLKDLNAATLTEGKFGIGKDRADALEQFGIEKKYLETALKFASNAKIDKYLNDTFKITSAVENVSDSEKKAEEANSAWLNNLPKEWGEVGKQLGDIMQDAASKGLDSFTFDSSVFSSLGDDFVAGLDKMFTDAGDDGKFTIKFSDFGFEIGGKKLNGNDLIKEIGLDTLVSSVMESVGIPFSEFGGIGTSEELNPLAILKDIGSNLMNIDKKDWLSTLAANAGKLFTWLSGANKEAEDLNKNDVEINVDDKELSAADAYLESLLDKYKLSEDVEIPLVTQGYNKLTSGDVITPKEQQALEKFFNGVAIGTYGSIDKARQWMESLGISWDTFLTYQTQGLDKFTSSAMAYSAEVKGLRDASDSYTDLDLVKDIHAGKWGEGLDRKKALEAANIDYDKAQKAYAEWLKGGDEAVLKLGDHYALLTDAEIEAMKKQQRYEEALATTPEGAFKSIGDFLNGVTHVLESDDTAASFSKFVTDIVGSLKNVNLENAPAFEQIGNFFKMVQQASNASTGITTDFGPMITSIADSLNSVELNSEQFKPIGDFLTEINKLSESASDVVAPFTGLVKDMVEMPTGDLGAKAGEAARIIVEHIIEVFLANYERFTEIGQNFIIQLINGMLSQRNIAAEAAATISSTLLSSFQEQAVAKASDLGQEFSTALATGLGSENSKAALKDAFNALFGMSTEGAEGMVGAEAGSMTSLGQSFGQSFGTDFISGFSQTVSAEQETLIGQLEPVVSGLTGITEAFNSIEDPGAAITNFVNSLGTASEESVDSEAMENIQVMADQINGVFSSAVPDGFGLGWNFVQGLLNGLQAAWDALGADITALAGQIGQASTSSVASAIDAHSPSRVTMRLGGYLVEGYKIGIQNGLSSVYKSGESIGEASLEGTKDSLGIHSPSDAYMAVADNVVMGLVNGVWTVMKEVEKGGYDIGHTLLMSTYDAMSDASTYDYFDPLLAQLDMEGQAFRNAVDKVGKISESYADRLQKTWNNMMLGTDGWANVFGSDRDERLMKEFGLTWADLYKLTGGSSVLNLDSITSISTTQIDTLTDSLSSLKDLVNAIWSGSYGVGHDARKAAAEQLGYNYDVVKKYVSAVQGDASSIDWSKAEEEAKAGGANIGVNTVKGVSTGIKERIVDIKNQAVQMVSKLTGTVTEELGIQSPSKVFMGFGNYIVEGLAIGIRDNTSVVTDNISDLSDILTSTFNESVINLADLVETDLNTDPVIRPVIDLTEVTKSASTIDSMLSREQAVAISTSQNTAKVQNGDEEMPAASTFNFTQNNYSPKALNRAEIYRQTRNQFAQLKMMKN